MKTPIRTCIACRKKAEKNSLLRIVKQKNTLIPDFTGNMPGRGAYVCKNKACLERISLKSLNHAFKTNLDKKSISIKDLLRNDDMDF